ncbi:MAG: hypothetical protein HYY49_00655 [Ignavibacteriales bacterium]|nr:hypothetical protein [Ignavibacteriales bacterium]
MRSRSVALKLARQFLVAAIPILSFFTPVFSQAQQPQKLNIAVLDFDSRGGITKDEAVTLSDVFNSQLVQSNEFIVVDRNRTKAILAEQGFQQTEACSQVECVVEAGKILKVQKMFFGTIGKVGRVYNVTIQMIDVETASTQLTESQNHQVDLEELLTDVIPDMAATVTQKITGRPSKARVITSGGSTWYWYVGGAVLVGGGAAAFLLKPKAGTITPADETLPGPPRLP